MKIDASTIDHYLDPRTLRALADLPLTSRRVVDGAMVGSHRSPLKGYSTEFADHREYVKGDDLRHLDWKVFSRTERYYVKRYEENTNLRAHLVVDCSASMAFPTSAAQRGRRGWRTSSASTESPRRSRSNGAMTKYEYACHLAAGLAYVLIRQQDPVGLVLFNDSIVSHLPPLRSHAHLRRLIETFAAAQVQSRTDTARAWQDVTALIKRRGLLIIISDLMDEHEHITQALAHFRHRGHDVIVIQVLDDAELHLPFDQTVTLRDMESASRLTVNGADIAADYSRQLSQWLDKCKQSCFEHHFDYVLANTATPHASLLTALLSRRQR